MHSAYTGEGDRGRAADSGSDSWRLEPSQWCCALSQPPLLSQHSCLHQPWLIVRIETKCQNVDSSTSPICSGAPIFIKEDFHQKLKNVGTFARNRAGTRWWLCKKFKSYRHFLTSCWCRLRITRLCRGNGRHTTCTAFCCILCSVFCVLCSVLCCTLPSFGR